MPEISWEEITRIKHNAQRLRDYTGETLKACKTSKCAHTLLYKILLSSAKDFIDEIDEFIESVEE